MKTGPDARGPLYASDLLGLALVALPLLVAVSTIESAGWVEGLPPLKLLVLASLLLGWLLTSTGTRLWVTGPAELVIGLGAALGLAAWQLNGDKAWSMGLLLMITAWWMAAITRWLTYRRSFAPLIASPGLLVVLVTLAFLPHSYYSRLFLFLLAAAPALVYFHFRWWTASQQRVPRALPLATGLAVMVVAIAPLWPASWPHKPLRPAVTTKLEDQWYNLVQHGSRLFDTVPNRRELPSFNLYPELPFTGPVQLRDDVLLLVKSQQPHKWRVQVYETYTPTGWTRSPDTATTESSTFRFKGETGKLEERREVKIGVRTSSTMILLASAGEPLSSSVAGRVVLSPAPLFQLDLATPQGTYLPPDVMELRNRLARLPNQQRLDSQLEELGLRRVETDEARDKAGGAPAVRSSSILVERASPTPEQPLALAFPQPQVPPRQYVTLGSRSIASPAQLQQAGQDYPAWVTDRYLQLPLEFPPAVSELAKELTKASNNPYDAAEALQGYLRTLPYSLEISPPPPGKDGVEYFLFSQRVGFCMYYASAMITMLRSLGIPARLVVGFAPGDPDYQRRAWIVRSRHYHAWPEVYFPGYGWVEFEPTPAGVQPALEAIGVPREEDQGRSTSEQLDECSFFPEFCDEAGQRRPDQLNNLLGGQDSGANAPGASDGAGKTGLLALFLVLAGLAGLVVVLRLSTGWYLRWATDRLGYATVTYNSMRLLGQLAGVPHRSTDTPREYAARLATTVSSQSDAIGRVTDAYIVTHYSRAKGLPYQELEGVRISWRRLRWSLVGAALGRFVPKWLKGRRRKKE